MSPAHDILASRTRRITMELSNWCNLAPIHKDCPAHQAGPKTVLPTEVIHTVIREAGAAEFTGTFAWHLYNEPLADHRIVDLCRYVKNQCPTSKGSLIWTNGDYLTAQLARALHDNGAYAIRVSVYTTEAANRLRDLAYCTPFVNWHFSSYLQGFDSRLEQYDQGATPAQLTGRKPCHAPLTDLTINHRGDLCLCCMDWQAKHSYGNVVRDGFLPVLNAAAPKMLAAQVALVDGCRDHPVCVSCIRERPADPDVLHATVPSPVLFPEHDNTADTFDPRSLP